MSREWPAGGDSCFVESVSIGLVANLQPGGGLGDVRSHAKPRRETHKVSDRCSVFGIRYSVFEHEHEHE